MANSLLADATRPPAQGLASYAAHPPLAMLAQSLRAPLLPLIGFAEMVATSENPAESHAWAAKIIAASRQVLAVLDCTLALAAGRAPPSASPETLAAAAEAVTALRSLLLEREPAGATGDCSAAQRMVA